jgi:hypothetical protein
MKKEKDRCVRSTRVPGGGGAEEPSVQGLLPSLRVGRGVRVARDLENHVHVVVEPPQCPYKLLPGPAVSATALGGRPVLPRTRKGGPMPRKGVVWLQVTRCAHAVQR